MVVSHARGWCIPAICGFFASVSIAAEPPQQWRCERLQGVTDYLKAGQWKATPDSYNAGSTVRIDFSTGDVDVFQDDETVESRAAGNTHASLVARTADSITWVENTGGLAPGVGLYTLFTTEGVVFYSYQRRVMGSGWPASSSLQAHCSRQK